jgi:uncharacterized membrane protein YeaQ/YmgE (transglycosylase-associated protein family)
MTAAQLIVYLLVALLVGLLAEGLVSAALPGGLIGTILAALLGIWLMLGVLHFVVPGDLNLAGVSLLTAILGAALVLVTWVLLTGVLASGRSWRWSRLDNRRGLPPSPAIGRTAPWRAVRAAARRAHRRTRPTVQPVETWPSRVGRTVRGDVLLRRS